MTPRLHRFARVSSTMDVIHQLAAEGAETGTVVIADEQLEGRGSRGRAWHSDLGGLWLSVLFRPPATEGIEVISLRVGLALAETIEPVAGRPIQLKWPNDLMLGDRKVGGVLCEARWQGGELGWVAVGVGLNVRNRMPPQLGALAVSLVEECPALTVDAMVGPVVDSLRRLDLQMDRLTALELSHFARRDWLAGRKLCGPVSGTVTGLASDGALLVRSVQGSDTSLRGGSIELVTTSLSR